MISGGKGKEFRLQIGKRDAFLNFTSAEKSPLVKEKTRRKGTGTLIEFIISCCCYFFITTILPHDIERATIPHQTLVKYKMQSQLVQCIVLEQRNETDLAFFGVFEAIVPIVLFYQAIRWFMINRETKHDSHIQYQKRFFSHKKKSPNIC